MEPMMLVKRNPLPISPDTRALERARARLSTGLTRPSAEPAPPPESVGADQHDAAAAQVAAGFHVSLALSERQARRLHLWLETMRPSTRAAEAVAHLTRGDNGRLHLELCVGTHPAFFRGWEVCQMLRIAKSTLYRYLKTGQLRGVRIGRRWRVSLDDILRTMTVP